MGIDGVFLWVRFIGHIAFPVQEEEQMCQARGKYPIFIKRFFAEFFPWSSVLVRAEFPRLVLQDSTCVSHATALQMAAVECD